MLMKKQSEPSPTRHVSLAEQGESAVAPVTSEVSGAEVFRRAGSKTRYTRRRPVKIVCVAANTRDGERLQLDEEYRAIEPAIRGARYRDVFQLIPKLGRSFCRGSAAATAATPRSNPLRDRPYASALYNPEANAIAARSSISARIPTASPAYCQIASACPLANHALNTTSATLSCSPKDCV